MWPFTSGKSSTSGLSSKRAWTLLCASFLYLWSQDCHQPTSCGQGIHAQLYVVSPVGHTQGPKGPQVFCANLPFYGNQVRSREVYPCHILIKGLGRGGGPVLAHQCPSRSSQWLPRSHKWETSTCQSGDQPSPCHRGCSWAVPNSPSCPEFLSMQTAPLYFFECEVQMVSAFENCGVVSKAS
jgi:hypothetical protein